MTSLSHDVFGTAKGAAYSAILCLFPTILVLTTLLALTPESDTLRGEMRAAFAEVLPGDTMSLLHAYFTNQKVRGEQVVFSAIVVSLVIWVVGEDLGMILASGATDPNSGPLLVLLALAYWPITAAAAAPAEGNRAR